MDGPKYKLGYKGALETIKLQKYTMIVMAVTVLVLVFANLQKRERLVLIPPVMEERMELAYASANEAYYKGYALFVASFLGNINPSNAQFVKEALSMSFAPALYSEMQAKITEDAEKMRVSGRSLRFFPDKILYEPGTGKTFVAGKQEIVSAAGNVHDQDVCYEMQVVIRDGMPQVAKFAYYQGHPRTEEWLHRNRHTQAVAASSGS